MFCVSRTYRDIIIRMHIENLYRTFVSYARVDLKFKAPGVPYVPALAIVINIYLIFRLSVLTLVRFTVWMIAGKYMVAIDRRSQVRASCYTMLPIKHMVYFFSGTSRPYHVFRLWYQEQHSRTKRRCRSTN